MLSRRFYPGEDVFTLWTGSYIWRSSAISLLMKACRFSGGSFRACLAMLRARLRNRLSCSLRSTLGPLSVPYRFCYLVQAMRRTSLQFSRTLGRVCDLLILGAVV